MISAVPHSETRADRETPTVEEFRRLMHAMVGALEGERVLDARASRYLRHESAYAQEAVYREVRRLDLPAGARVVELGAGHGLLAYGLAAGGFRVTAADYFNPLPETTSRMAAVAKQRARGPLHLDFVKQDLGEADWCLPPEAFDVVISVDVVEHVGNVVHFMTNCRRLLKRGGHHIVHTPNFGALACRYRSAKSVLRPVWPVAFESFVRSNPWYGHVREYNARELLQLFDAFGFEVLSQRFPRGADVECLRELDGRLSARRRLFHALGEGVRRSWPTLGPVQLVVGVKR